MSSCRTEEEIQADIRAVQTMMARGVLSMTYDGRSITYRSLEELREAKAMLETELGQVAPSSARSTRTYALFSKGY